MIRIISNSRALRIELIRGRNAQASENITKDVYKIINEVKNNGDDAVRKYTKLFDGVDLDDFLVSEAEIAQAYKKASRHLITAMQNAAESIYNFHKRQLHTSWSQMGPKKQNNGTEDNPASKSCTLRPGWARCISLISTNERYPS